MLRLDQINLQENVLRGFIYSTNKLNSFHRANTKGSTLRRLIVRYE